MPEDFIEWIDNSQAFSSSITLLVKNQKTSSKQSQPQKKKSIEKKQPQLVMTVQIIPDVLLETMINPLRQSQKKTTVITVISQDTHKTLVVPRMLDLP